MANYTREPGVYSREQVIGYTEPALAVTELGTLTRVQIVSETGPANEDVLISGQAQLLSTFTIKKELKASMPKCFLEAAYIGLNSPLLVRRVAPVVQYGVLGKCASLDLLAGSKILCSIYHKYANLNDIMKITVTPDKTDSSLYSIKLDSVVHDPADETGENDLLLFSETYKLSLKRDSVNEAGISNCITMLQDYREDLVVQLNEDGVVSNIKTSGLKASVAVDPVNGASVYFGRYPSEEGKENAVYNYMNGLDANMKTAWKSAIEELPELEIQNPAFVFSTTIPSVNPGTDQREMDIAVGQAAAAIWSTPIYNPYFTDYSYENVRSLEYPAGLIGQLVLPGFYDTSMLGSSILFGGGLLYHMTFCSNKAAGKPFAPMMGTENGLIPSSIKLATEYTKTQRIALGNKGIQVIKHNKVRGIKHFVDNTSLRSASIVDEIAEEQNRNEMNKIHVEIDNMLDDFVGKYNIEETRDKCEKAIDDYFKDNIMTLKPYTIKDYSKQCNVENNPTSIIRQRRLEVMVGVTFNNAIREVNILYKIIPTA